VLQTGPMMGLIERATAEHFTVHRLHEAADREALLSKIAADVVAVSTGSHTGVKTDAALMARLPKLRIVANFGVGYDSIDMSAAAARGIIVTNTPDVLTEEVADTALGLMLMTVRELSAAERWLREGRWEREGDYRLTPASLRDRKLGMVGMGRIGEAIATRAAAFGMPIAYHSRTPKAGTPYRYVADLATLARESDILMVITPGGPATKNLIDARVLEALGPNGILINMARGSVVDEPALLAALKARTILSAGLDVFWNEPKIDPAFLALDNVVLLPHVGSASVWTRDKMGQLVADNLAALARGTPPLTPVPETPFKGW
jgi:lactate dehydrogenase-like 2-hydroxyacid dehydrogenase